MVVVAPAKSQVFRIPVEDGEFVLPGVPLITLVDLSDMWVQFDLREDLLRDLKLGSKIDVPGARTRKSRYRAGSSRHWSERGIYWLAGHPGQRRLRPAHLRDSRLSD